MIRDSASRPSNGSSTGQTIKTIPGGSKPWIWMGTRTCPRHLSHSDKVWPGYSQQTRRAASAPGREHLRLAFLQCCYLFLLWLTATSWRAFHACARSRYSRIMKFLAAGFVSERDCSSSAGVSTLGVDWHPQSKAISAPYKERRIDLLITFLLRRYRCSYITTPIYLPTSTSRAAGSINQNFTET